MRCFSVTIAGAALLVQCASARAQSAGGETIMLREQIAAERSALEEQQRSLDAQRGRLQALEQRLIARTDAAHSRDDGAAPRQATAMVAAPRPNAANRGGVQTVGEAPSEQRSIDVAVLADQGGVITQAGRLTLEGDLEYARADRNRVLFRGVAIPEAVLIGAFDINESRQDVVTVAAVARFGISNRLEINGRLPLVYRADNSALAPVVNNGGNTNVGTDRTVSSSNLGDVDFGIRYQLTGSKDGWPYLIIGAQAVAPSGTDPFAVPRDGLGNPLSAATGAGFWGVTPTLTAILPSDPAVLFGTLGYTFNFARHIDRRIGSAIVERVSPGGQPTTSLGIAIALNPRVSLSLGYAHTLALGTKTRLRTINPQSQAISEPMSVRTRNLQLGRLLFGVSYRANAHTTINWNIEFGATDDATDLRTTLRIPLSVNMY
jgi:hypothetical protein